MVMDLKQEDIRDIVLTSIFGNDDLYDKLTLKGGNALALQGVNVRASQDLDFSISHGINLDQQTYEPIFEDSLSNGFNTKGYKVINFSFIPKPPKKRLNAPEKGSLTDSSSIIWGGYHIKFGIIKYDLYNELVQKKANNIGAHAETIGKNKKLIEIDISKDEYTKNREKKDLNGFTIYIYTPLMIVYEKVRASCQQLPQYRINGQKERARDLFDIYELTSTNPSLLEQVTSKNNIDILIRMFEIKLVKFKLLTKLDSYTEQLRSDYENNVIPQIKTAEKPSFDFLMDYSKRLFDQLYFLTKKQ